MICPGNTLPASSKVAQTRQRIRNHTSEPVSYELDVSGTLVAGPDGPLLLAADHGVLYVINDARDFVVGDRVRVTGMRVPLHVTIYEHGDACILNDSITAGGSVVP